MFWFFDDFIPVFNSFQGMNVKNKVPMLLEILDNYDLQNLCDFFES